MVVQPLPGFRPFTDIPPGRGPQPAETGRPILPARAPHEEDDFLPTSFGPSDYALIPLYALFYAINPMAAAAVLASLQFWEVIHRIRTAR